MPKPLEPLDQWDFQDTIFKPWLGDHTEIDVTVANFNILIDHHNKLVKFVNAIATVLSKEEIGKKNE